MLLTENQQNLAKAYGKRALNNELYKRGVIPKAIYEIAAEKLILEIDRFDKLCYNDSIIHTEAV